MPSESELVAKVRNEARLALGESATEVLGRTHAMHLALQAELTTLANRRGCGFGILIERVLGDGLSERALAMFNRVAQKKESRHCTRLTLNDADRVGAISQEQREHADLDAALGTLAGWLTKAVAADESRHLADDECVPDASPNSLCRGCPSTFDYETRAAVAAYLASFAAKGVGDVALFRHVALMRSGEPRSRRRSD